ncbi:MAG: hypothetical protein AAGD05_02650 [Bacteroidota bacterium]
MKNTIFTLSLFLLTAFGVVAQSQSFNYQGVARDNGMAVDGTIGLQLSVRSLAPNGTIVYQEQQFPTTNNYGVFDVEVGGAAANVTIGNFASINWSEVDFFFQVELDVNGGTNFTDMGATKITTVPLAIQAQASALLKDTDDDTRVEVEQTPDADLIRFEVAGSEFVRMNGKTLELFPNVANHNTFIGRSAGAATTGGSNTFIGSRTGASNTTGEVNTFLGWDAGFFNTEGSDNVFIGRQAGTGNITGINNTYVGSRAGRASIGSSNLFMGFEAGLNENGNNKLYIENSSSSSPLIYGEFDNDLVQINGKLGLGPIPPVEAIHVRNGNIRLDNGNFQSFGPIVLQPDVDESGDAIFQILESDGSLMVQADNAVMKTFGPNGSQNIRMSKLELFPNNGFLAIRDENNDNQAGAFVDAGGNGVIFADVKNFVMQHPQKANQDIWYASLEGPEAGAYDRGTAQLVNGEAFIPFSDHFQIVANPVTMTVVLTPNEWDTYGLAVTEKTATGFKVRELKGGTGHFTFDWEVKCVRKGFEDYQVVRDRSYYQEGSR